MFHSQWRFLLISSYFCLQSAIDLKKTPPLFNRASSQSLSKLESTFWLQCICTRYFISSICLLFVFYYFLFHRLESITALSQSNTWFFIFIAVWRCRSCHSFASISPTPSCWSQWCSVRNGTSAHGYDCAWGLRELGFRLTLCWNNTLNDCLLTRLEQPGNVHTISKGRVYFIGNSTPN